MDKSSQIDCYLYFMWNAWSKERCIEMYGKVMGEHFWAKWNKLYETYTAIGAPAPFYSELGFEARNTIVQYAFNYYNK